MSTTRKETNTQTMDDLTQGVAEATGRVAEKITSHLDQERKHAADTVRLYASAVNNFKRDLQSIEGEEVSNSAVESAQRALENAADYIEQVSPQQLTEDAREFATRHKAPLVAGAALTTAILGRHLWKSHQAKRDEVAAKNAVQVSSSDSEDNEGTESPDNVRQFDKNNKKKAS